MSETRKRVEDQLREQACRARVQPSNELRLKTLNALRAVEPDNASTGDEFVFSRRASGTRWKLAAGLLLTAGLLAAAASILSRHHPGGQSQIAQHNPIENTDHERIASGVLFANLERLTKPADMGRDLLKPFDREATLFKADMHKAWNEFQADLPKLPKLNKPGPKTQPSDV
ncbi:MAG TPA: hypothetical protein VG711_05190 [Phycisphaerales bacterium]|nr:hypothetical protein [Phycisphaerales bacterium]